jgi:hypothetical protein
MHIYNKIHILLPFLLHVSAPIAQSSGKTIYMLETIVAFATFVQLLKKICFNVEIEM